AKFQRGVTIPAKRTERGALTTYLAVVPGTHDEVILVVRRVLRLHCRVGVHGAPHVFLVPQPLYPHRWHGQRLCRHRLVEGLRLPEHVIGGMFQELAPPWQLFEAGGASEAPRPPPARA